MFNFTHRKNCMAEVILQLQPRQQKRRNESAYLMHKSDSYAGLAHCARPARCARPAHCAGPARAFCFELRFY